MKRLKQLMLVTLIGALSAVVPFAAEARGHGGHGGGHRGSGSGMHSAPHMGGVHGGAHPSSHMHGGHSHGSSSVSNHGGYQVVHLAPSMGGGHRGSGSGMHSVPHMGGGHGGVHPTPHVNRGPDRMPYFGDHRRYHGRYGYPRWDGHNWLVHDLILGTTIAADVALSQALWNDYYRTYGVTYVEPNSTYWYNPTTVTPTTVYTVPTTVSYATEPLIVSQQSTPVVRYDIPIISAFDSHERTGTSTIFVPANGVNSDVFYAEKAEPSVSVNNQKTVNNYTYTFNETHNTVNNNYYIRLENGRLEPVQLIKLEGTDGRSEYFLGTTNDFARVVLKASAVQNPTQKEVVLQREN